MTTATGGIARGSLSDAAADRLARDGQDPPHRRDGLHRLARWRRALLERGDDLRVTVREGSDTREIDDLDAEQVRCDVLDRRAVRRAMKGVDRVFHAAGMTSVRPEDAERLFEVNVGGTRTVLEESPARRGRARDLHLQRRGARPAPSAAARPTRRQLFTAGPPRHPVRELRARGRGGGAAAGRAGPAAGVREPHGGLRPRRHPRDVHPPGPQLPARPGARLRGRRPQRRRRPRRRRRATCSPTSDGEVGERYILGGRNFTFDRLFADLGRLSGVEPPRQGAAPPGRRGRGAAADRPRADHARARRR